MTSDHPKTPRKDSGFFTLYDRGTSGQASAHQLLADYLIKQWQRKDLGRRRPYLIGISGSVAAGKSHTAKLLTALFAENSLRPSGQTVATDNFLQTNRDLDAHGLANRKGYPESFDRQGLFDFLKALRAGQIPIEIPVYSHEIYDIDPVRRQRIDASDIVIIEGLNLPRPVSNADDARRFSDLIDLSIYIEADEALLRNWFLERFGVLLRTAYRDPASALHELSAIPETEALARAEQAWQEINLPNFRENIAPGRQYADIILRKGPAHRVETVLIQAIPA